VFHRFSLLYTNGMNYTPPLATVVVLTLALLASVALVVIPYRILRKRYQSRRSPFFIGIAVFVLFALVLEQIIHLLVLKRTPIAQIPWAFALYGGAMAALFEESGRWIAFKTLLKRQHGDDRNALMYGVGHGGIEVILIYTATMAVNLTYAIMLRISGSQALLAGMETAKAVGMEQLFAALATTTSSLYLVGLAERVLAMTLHMGFSVLVWYAAKNKGDRALFWVAVALHFAVDAAAVWLRSKGVALLAIEAVVLLFAILTAILAYRVARARWSVLQNPNQEAVEVG
jgi:uncharacterized membrane protein YhfC